MSKEKEVEQTFPEEGERVLVTQSPATRAPVEQVLQE